MTSGLPDPPAIATTLAEINASAEFARAPVMRHLLGYLVDETMAGRGDRLKAYSIAVDALGRNPDFDAQTDSYPRVQIGRLRRMIDAFYATDPQVPLRLTIPLGAYAVRFDPAQSNENASPVDPGTPAARRRQQGRGPFWIAFAATGALCILAGLLAWYALGRSPKSEVAALVPPPTISIESDDGAATADGRAIIADVNRRIGTAFTRSGVATVLYGGASVGSRYALLLDLSTDGASLSLRLIDRQQGRLAWGDMVPLPPDKALMAEAIDPYISSLVRPNGIVASQQAAEMVDDYRPGYPCMLHFAKYAHDRTPELLQPVTACVNRTVSLAPNHAPALAAASFLVLTPHNSPITHKDLMRARALSRRAVSADPYLAAALLAEGRIAFVENNCARAVALADRTLALERHDPEAIGLVGFRLTQCDRPRALALLRSARELEPDLTIFLLDALIILELDAGNDANAVAVGEMMQRPGPGLAQQYLLGQVLTAIARRQPVEAQAIWQKMVRSAPPRATMDEILSPIYMSSGFRAIVANELRKAGIAAPADSVAARPPDVTSRSSYDRRKAYEDQRGSGLHAGGSAPRDGPARFYPRA